MKEKSNIRILIHSVYMILFYSLVGICVSTAVSYYSVEMYQKHYILCTFFAALITIPFCLRQMKCDGFLARERQFLRENVSVSNFLAIVILSISACVALNYWIKMLGLMELFHGYDRVEKLIYGNSLEILRSFGTAGERCLHLLFYLVYITEICFSLSMHFLLVFCWSMSMKYLGRYARLSYHILWRTERLCL